MGYDGIVLESWSIWAAYGILHDPHLRNLVNVKLSAPYKILSIISNYIICSFGFEFLKVKVLLLLKSLRARTSQLLQWFF